MPLPQPPPPPPEYDAVVTPDNGTNLQRMDDSVVHLPKDTKVKVVDVVLPFATVETLEMDPKESGTVKAKDLKPVSPI